MNRIWGIVGFAVFTEGGWRRVFTPISASSGTECAAIEWSSGRRARAFCEINMGVCSQYGDPLAHWVDWSISFLAGGRTGRCPLPYITRLEDSWAAKPDDASSSKAHLCKGILNTPEQMVVKVNGPCFRKRGCFANMDLL